MYNEDISDDSRKAAKYTLRKVIEDSLKILAPITPYFAEEVYQYFQPESPSIHKELWPSLEEGINESSENTGNVAISLISEIRRFKSSNKIALNQPLNTVNVYTDNQELTKILNEFSEDIAGTLKISNLGIKSGKPEIHEEIIEIEPDMSQIGPKFKSDAGKVIGYIKSNNPNDIAKKLEKDGEIIIADKPITVEDLKMTKEVQGATGQKVDVFQSEELDLILEIIK